MDDNTVTSLRKPPQPVKTDGAPIHRQAAMSPSPQRKEVLDAQLQKMIGLTRDSPVTTEQVRIAFENAELRVEHNLVRNIVTGEQRSAMRLALPDDSQYLAVTIPILPDGRLVFVTRYLYPIGRWSLEFPRHVCRMRDSGWRAPAEENLLNVAGLKSDNWRLLGAVQVDPALMSVTTLVMRAEACTQVREIAADAAQSIAGSIVLADDELDHLLATGQVTCGVTLAALCLFRVMPQTQQES